VGRLDAHSEGLLLLTNDGDLAQHLTHPRYEIDKEYEVILDRPWDSALTPKLLLGIFLDGQNAKIARLHSMTPTRLRVVLRQGINRQIRRMFEAVGYRVKRLVRTRMGNLRLGDLPRGHWRALTKSELTSLKRPRKTVASPVMEDGPPTCRKAGASVSHDRRKRLSSATSLRRAQ
jgi:pseudouridine synthase